MDHSEAVRLRAAEKYVLGELAGDVRDEYEEHYFGCVECAADVKATAAFAAMSRTVFLEDAAVKPVPAEPRLSFTERFRWAFAAVGALAALFVVVFYQNSVTIPKLKSEASLAGSSSYNKPFELGASAMHRGESVDATAVIIDPRQGLAFTFDFTPPTPRLASYVCQFKDLSGRVLLQVPISSDKMDQTATLLIPGGLVTAPGKYEIAFLGADPASGLPTQTSSAFSFAITIAFRQ
jgi:hypothetical protein